jgi:hypothetical protein
MEQIWDYANLALVWKGSSILVSSFNCLWLLTTITETDSPNKSEKTVAHSITWSSLWVRKTKERRQNWCESGQKMKCAYVSLSIANFSPNKGEWGHFFNLIACWHNSLSHSFCRSSSHLGLCIEKQAVDRDKRDIMCSQLVDECEVTIEILITFKWKIMWGSGWQGVLTSCYGKLTNYGKSDMENFSKVLKQ